jgi:hypothetical protein
MRRQRDSGNKSLFLPLDTNEIGVKYEQRDEKILSRYSTDGVT